MTEEISTYADRIIDAYRILTPAPGEPVSLSELRPQVGGHRPLVDAALRHLARQPGVTLMPEANQKVLSDWDRECAIVHGDQHKHMITID